MARPNVITEFVMEEIDRMVDEAVQNGQSISAAHVAAGILKIYPRSGLLAADVANEVMMTAARKGVAVQIGAHRNEVHALPELRPVRQSAHA